MTRRLFATIGFVLVALALAPPVVAQHIATETTLSAAMTSTQMEMTVASATTFAANALVWVDRELMRVGSVSGTTITLTRRSVNGTRQGPHRSGARVTVSMETAGQVHFYNYDPDYGAACTSGTGQASVSPWINTATGIVWVCSGAANWNGTSGLRITYNSNQAYIF